MNNPPELQRAYATFNRSFFSGQLPDDTILKWTRSLGRGLGQFQPRDPGIILLNVRTKPWPRVWKITLLHEMAHLATEDETEEHGPRWQALMKRLRNKSAFDDYL